MQATKKAADDAEKAAQKAAAAQEKVSKVVKEARAARTKAQADLKATTDFSMPEGAEHAEQQEMITGNKKEVHTAKASTPPPLPPRTVVSCGTGHPSMS